MRSGDMNTHTRIPHHRSMHLNFMMPLQCFILIEYGVAFDAWAYVSACAQGRIRIDCVESQMPTLSSIVNEAPLNIKLHLLNADILSAQRDYTRIYSAIGCSPQLERVLTLINDLQIVKRISLGTSTFEDRLDDARDARVAALELGYEQRIGDAFQNS